MQLASYINPPPNLLLLVSLAISPFYFQSGKKSEPFRMLLEFRCYSNSSRVGVEHFESENQEFDEDQFEELL